jgi:ribosomal protein L7/L12
LGLRKQSVGQSLIQEEEKCYDLVRLEDGSELWFDITDAFRRSQEEPGNAVYRVRLEHVGSSRLKVLALIREIWGLTPAEAESLVDSSRPILGTIESKHRNDVLKKFWDVGAVLDFE